VKPENKVYKEGEVYNNSKYCYNIIIIIIIIIIKIIKKKG